VAQRRGPLDERPDGPHGVAPAPPGSV
jgi:hypothetical protein